MSREVKFRLWYDNKMILPESADWEDFFINPDGNVCRSEEIGTYEAYRYYFYIKDSILMQFTGLKDKNGKEIYEGDIFREEKEMDFGDERNYSVVMWINQRGCFYLVPVDHYHVLTYNDCEKEKDFEWLFEDANLYDFSLDIGLDLVGNIYENPELLEL